MKLTSSRLRTRIWIAIFAILMNALAPSISHALAFASDDPSSWEICRSDRSQSLVSDQGLVKQTSDSVGSMDHCGYCLPHAGSYSLLPESVTGMGVFGNHALRPFLFYRAPQPLLALSASPPRGPPAHA